MRDEAPWYRHLWVWLIMIPPAGAVVGGVATAWLAGGPPALVVDDYSEIALATTQRLERDRRALALGLGGRLELAAAGEDYRATLEIAQADGGAPDGALALRLVHPTRAELDRDALLSPIGAGRFRGRIERPAGRFYVQVGDAAGEWRLVGELPAAGAAVVLAPAGSGAP